jgi:hypothetical protein
MPGITCLESGAPPAQFQGTTFRLEVGFDGCALLLYEAVSSLDIIVIAYRYHRKNSFQHSLLEC